MFKNKKFLLRLSTPIILIVLIFSVVSLTKKLNPKNEQASTIANTDSTAVGVTTVEDEITDSYIAYIVDNGDTLYSISRQYAANCPDNIAVKTLAKINNLSNAAALDVGMTLTIPTEYFDSGEIYTVQKGDTLFSIAKSFLSDTEVSTYVEKIMDDNFLVSSEIKTGDELFITAEKLTY